MKAKLNVLSLFALVLAALFLVGRTDAQQSGKQPQGHKNSEHKIFLPRDLQWQPGPGSLPEGAQVAVLEGDPSKPGPFTMRLKLPPNYRIPPHTHPKVERVTVLEGEAKIGMGREYREEGMRRLPAGSFFAMPPGMEHFAGTDAGAVIQLNGVGPWEITYLNPADDPRKPKR